MPRTRRQKSKAHAAGAPANAPPRSRRSQRNQPAAAVATETEDHNNEDLQSEEEIDTMLTPVSYVFEGVSYPSYQEMVNAKRKRNEEVLQGLGFGDTRGGPILPVAKKTTATQRGIKKQKTVKGPLPRRKSSRLSSEKSSLVALDYNVRDWNRDNTVVDVGEGDAGAKDREPEKPRYPKGRLNDGDDLTMKESVEALDNKWIKDDSIESAETFVKKTLLELSHGESDEAALKKERKSPTSVTVNSLDTDMASMVERLSIENEEWVAKVTPDRIYSVTAHPSEDKLIACAGDKWGHIGLWDVDAPESDTRNGVHLFRVHSRPVCGLQWATPDTMISASYDGTIRRLNVDTGVFQEIFATYDDSDTYYAEELGFGIDEGYNFWHQHVSLDHRYGGSDPCLFLATSVGKALHLDLRSPSKQRITFNEQLSGRKINTLSLHPNGYTLASAGNDGLVNLWDIRKFQNTGRIGKSPNAIATQRVGLSVSSSYFSPSGGCLLSTSMANKLDLIDDVQKMKGDMKPTTRIQHNNQTGRWLSTIMATWHPKQDLFVSGSMKKPRCIEIFDNKGELLREVTGESLTAVASRCCFHPSTEKLAVIGGNSSGRVVAVR